MTCSLPGKYIVESWPWLLKLPVCSFNVILYLHRLKITGQRSLQWFRWEAEEQRRRDVKLLTHLLDDVKSRTAEGTCPPCLASETLSKREEMGVSELQVAYTVSSPFGAGIETVSNDHRRWLVDLMAFSDIRNTFCFLP